MTRPRLSIVLGADAAGAVLSSGARQDWRLPVPRQASIADAIHAVTAQLPPQHARKRLHLVVGLPSPQARAKLVNGLPPTHDATLLTAAVSQQLDRFFIRLARRQRGSVVRPSATGCAWAAAFDEDALEEIARAAAACGLLLEGVLPTEWMLGTAEASAADGSPPTPLELAERLAGTALGAAPLALGMGAAAAVGSLEMRRRWRVPVLVALCTVVASAFTPLVSAELAMHAARERLRAIGPARNAAVRSARAISGDSASNHALARFLEIAPRRTLLLAALAGALPESTAIVQLQVDSTLAEVTLAAPRVGPAIDSLVHMPGVLRSALMGGVSRRGAGGGLEQVQLRLVLGAAPYTAPLSGAIARIP